MPYTKRILLAILLALCLVPTPGRAQELSDTADSSKKQLAIISAYNEEAVWPRNYIRTIIQEMAEHPEFGPVRVAYMCNAFVHDEEDFRMLEGNILDTFGEGYRPDCLVLIGNFAITLRDKIKEQWGDIPMLFITQTSKYGPIDFYYTSYDQELTFDPSKLRPVSELQEDYNLSAIYTPTRYRETVDMMMHMQPEMKKFVFLADNLYLSRYYNHRIEEYINLKYPDVEYVWQMATNEGDLVPYLNDDNQDMGLLLSTWYYERENAFGFPMIYAADSYIIIGAHKPVFGLRFAYLNYGIIGGVFDDAHAVEQSVVDGLQDLIEGKDMSKIPFRGPQEPKPYINWHRMEALGISEEICPEGTEYLYRPENMVDSGKVHLWIGIGIAAVLLLLLLVVRLAKRGPKFHQNLEGTIYSMPIGYIQAMLFLDKEGKVKTVEYSQGNECLKELNSEHGISGMYADQDPVFWQEAADILRIENKPKTTLVKSPDGEYYVEFIVTASPESTRTRLLVDIFAIDVTDKIKIEQVLRKAADTAIEADNMKSAFLANMSHEIRTPLNAIVGFSNLLCKTTDPEKKKRFMEIIETNNKLLLKLVGDILDITKADSDKLVINWHRVDVNKLINNVCAGIDMTSRPHVRLEKKLGREQCFITSDSYRLTQVLNNLITNAVKFTERGSITVGYEAQGDMLRFYVRDTGLGITETDLKKLFTRFTKLNSFVQGTGLGLSISKAIVEKLGGTIKGESAGKSKGATFWFTIPNTLDEQTEEQAEERIHDDERRLEELRKRATSERRRKQINNAAIDEKATMPSYKKERKKILVVEDNPSNTELVYAMLADRYILVHAADGKQAVRMYVKETPDLVLMDLNLPGKNGYEATAEIRTLSNTVPIIAVTAHAQRSDRERVFSSGFDDYISKPIDEALLIDTIRKFLG